MLNIYFIAIFTCSIMVPIFLHSLLKRKLQSSSALIAIELSIGFLILFAGTIIPIYPFLSTFPDYPKVTKSIDDHYYFTQQEYGWAGSMPGKHLHFYERKKYWFDKSIGHIEWQIGTGDMNAKMQHTASEKVKRVIITENDHLVLDTILHMDKNFDFEYLSWREW